MRGGLTVVAVGGLVGIVATLGLGTLLEGFLVGVTGLDPWALLMAPTVLLAISALAAWLPARRISRVDPVVALRSD